MFRKLNNRKGQSTLEYGIVIAVIVGALIMMQVYIKRGVMGRLKQSTDDVGGQFSARSSTLDFTTTSNSKSREIATPMTATAVGGNNRQVSTTTQHVAQRQNKVGMEHVAQWDDTDEDWRNQ